VLFTSTLIDIVWIVDTPEKPMHPQPVRDLCAFQVNGVSNLCAPNPHWCTVLAQPAGDWWFGRVAHGTAEGYFPRAFVELLPSAVAAAPVPAGATAAPPPVCRQD